MNDMTDEQRSKKALADLHNKIEILFAAEIKRAHDKLDHLAESGSGIVEDHRNEGLNYITAHRFMEAYKQDSQSSKHSRAEMKIIKNYRILM